MDAPLLCLRLISAPVGKIKQIHSFHCRLKVDIAPCLESFEFSSVCLACFLLLFGL